MFISEKFSNSHKLTKKQWFVAISLLLFFLLCATLIQQLGYPELYFIFPITLLIGFGLLYNPKLWLSIFLLSVGLYLSSGGEGVSVIEVVLGAGLSGGLLVWLIGYKYVGKKPYIQGLSEYLLVFFYLLSIPNAVIAYLNDVPMFDWFRMYLVISMLFYYIPLRIYFGDKEGIRYVSKLLALMVVIIVGYHYYTYYTYVTRIEFAYQIGKGVRENLGFLSTLLVVLSGMIYSVKGIKNKSVATGLMIMVLTALITTFARTYWVTAFLGLGFLFIYLKPKEKLFTVGLFIAFSTLTLITLQILLGDIYELALKALSDRVSSSTKGTSDVSLMMRLVEYEEAFKQISMYPMGGKGLAAKIDFYIPQVMQYWTTHNIHNSFIYTMYKFGIPLTIMYVTSFILLGYRSFKSISLQKEKYFRYLAIGVFSGFVTLFLASFFANNFFGRDSVVLISFLVYYSSTLYNIEKKDKKVN